MDKFKKFYLKELENEMEVISKNLNKKNKKDRKIIHVGLINHLIKFFRTEYPHLNRQPLKDLISFLIETDTKNNSSYSSHNGAKILPKLTRKKKADTLIVAALELLIDHGFDEKDAFIKANQIIKTKNEAYFRKLLKLYKSNLLHPNIKLLLSDLKKEGKKRANVEDAAIIFFEKAFQNIK